MPEFPGNIPVGNADKDEIQLQPRLRQWDSNEHFSLSPSEPDKSSGNKPGWSLRR